MGQFPDSYSPTVFDNFVADIQLDGKPVQLALWDTAGQEEYERLRPLSYSKAHIILIAFSVDTADSLDNVTNKVRRNVKGLDDGADSHSPPQWIEEVRSICGQHIPVILVGLKTDLRDKAKAQGTYHPDHFVETAEGQRIANAIGARSYFECSALLNQGVDDVFEAATRAAMLVRDSGHGGTGLNPSGAGPTHGRKDSHPGKRTNEKRDSHGAKCCVIC